MRLIILGLALAGLVVGQEAVEKDIVSDSEKLEVETLESDYWQVQTQLVKLQAQSDGLVRQINEKIAMIQDKCEANEGRFDASGKTIGCLVKQVDEKEQ